MRQRVTPICGEEHTGHSSNGAEQRGRECWYTTTARNRQLQANRHSCTEKGGQQRDSETRSGWEKNAMGELKQNLALPRPASVWLHRLLTHSVRFHSPMQAARFSLAYCLSVREPLPARTLR